MARHRLGFVEGLLYAASVIRQFNTASRLAAEHFFALSLDASQPDGPLLMLRAMAFVARCMRGAYISDHVGCHPARGITAAVDAHDSRAGVKLGVLPDLLHRRRGNVFRHDLVAELFGHGEGLRKCVAGGLGDFVPGRREPIGPRGIGGGRGSGIVVLSPSHSQRDPLYSPLYFQYAGLPTGEFDPAEGSQAVVQVVALATQLLHFVGQPGRIAAMGFG